MRAATEETDMQERSKGSGGGDRGLPASMPPHATFRRHLPLIGILISACLFFVAASSYPGGTTDSASSVGYDWAHNFISSLFAAKALNGAASPARFVAIPAMLVLCVSIGALFKSISNQGASRALRKTIEISGIGSAVYSFLVVTPMHDLMIDIALPFALIAQLATLHLLYVRRSLLFWVGSACILLLLLSAAMYYGNLFFGLLPVVQKVSLVACLGWLVAVHYTISHRMESEVWT
jgi:hypothetical protein